jgi:short-chain Z-isoprenyl diphosphate synthase
VGLKNFVYGVYERQLAAQIPPDRIPRHVGVILDGNRRWATAQGSTSDQGHQAGANKIVDFLGWCDDAGVEVVTLWLLSTDNLTRPEIELDKLMTIIESTVENLVTQGRWRLHPVGALDLLPAHTATLLKEAEEATRTINGSLVNIAVGYGGRREVVDAVKSLLSEHATQGTTLDELAQFIDVDHIAEHLYTKGQPDPD